MIRNDDENNEYIATPKHRLVVMIALILTRESFRKSTAESQAFAKALSILRQVRVFLQAVV